MFFKEAIEHVHVFLRDKEKMKVNKTIIKIIILFVDSVKNDLQNSNWIMRTKKKKRINEECFCFFLSIGIF